MTVGDSDARSSFRELTRNALRKMATESGTIQDRLISANVEIGLASMYKHTVPDDWRERYNALYEAMRTDALRDMDTRSAERLALEIYEIAGAADYGFDRA